MLVNGRWSHQDDTRVMSNDLRMGDNLLDIGAVLGKRDVLLVRSVWQRCIVGSEEDDLFMI
jgi:hypothetical protein